MIGAPVFHVNGDDPEACYWVAKLAVDYRQAFNKDVVIDMVCYRRRGHNEGDDPSMTQPAMYDVIDAKRSVRKTYTESLIGRGDISVDEAEKALQDFSSQLEHVFNEVRELEKHPVTAEPVGRDRAAGARRSCRPAITREVLEQIADAHVNLPEGFTPHPRVKPVLERRAKMAREGGIDWAFAELLAFGSLALEGRTGPAGRPGLAARHVRAAARGADRPQDRRGVHAAAEPVRGPGQVHGLRLGAVGVRGAGLRVRLLGGQPGRAGAVGGAVRRLRQRRAADHRRVHLVRRGQVGPASPTS